VRADEHSRVGALPSPAERESTGTGWRTAVSAAASRVTIEVTAPWYGRARTAI
jgi:hypothetical protein